MLQSQTSSLRCRYAAGTANELTKWRKDGTGQTYVSSIPTEQQQDVLSRLPIQSPRSTKNPARIREHQRRQVRGAITPSQCEAVVFRQFPCSSKTRWRSNGSRRSTVRPRLRVEKSTAEQRFGHHQRNTTSGESVQLYEAFDS